MMNSSLKEYWNDGCHSCKKGAFIDFYFLFEFPNATAGVHLGLFGPGVRYHMTVRGAGKSVCPHKLRHRGHYSRVESAEYSSRVVESAANPSRTTLATALRGGCIKHLLLAFRRLDLLGWVWTLRSSCLRRKTPPHKALSACFLSELLVSANLNSTYCMHWPVYYVYSN